MSNREHKPVEPGQRRRILVADDEQRMADSVKTLLSNYGYEVDVAYSGREAIKKLLAENFDLVITDLRMADADGFEIMRSLEDRPELEFIVITGHASTESAIEAIHHEAFDYITKPFEIEVLRASVERAFAKIETNRFRDDMISMITHDIKVPLSSIINYSSLVFDKQTDALHPRAREFVQTINSNGTKILSLIDNFLTSCKIEAGKLSIYPREVNFNYILDDLTSVFQVEFERCQVQFRSDCSITLPTIMGDENLLFRALGNVLSNACKYTPRDGVITLQTAILDRDKSPLGVPSVLLEVTNTGPGIPPEDLPTIFDKYQRSRVHGGVEGSGIGSYVLRYVVEAHGGQVFVHSVPNDLTTFSIYLPVRGSEGIGESESQT